MFHSLSHCNLLVASSHNFAENNKSDTEIRRLSFQLCNSSRKLVILFAVIAAAVIVLWLGGIVSVVCSIVLSKGHRPYKSC